MFYHVADQIANQAIEFKMQLPSILEDPTGT